MDIKGKTVLITGGAKRIGKALVLGFAKDGADIIIHYNTSEDDALSLKREVEALGVNVFTVKANLFDEEQVKALGEKALKLCGKVDILINNASIYHPTDFFSGDTSDLDRFMAIHLKAPYILSQILGKVMYKNKAGRIVNISDYAGILPYKGFTPYSVSKGALITLTKALAKELAPYVLVNCVMPGPIVPHPELDDLETPLQKTVLKKWAGEKEVYKAVKYLVETEFTTGACIPVEGGRLLC
ncbi:MAG: SDR family NAD(P)-dependent oxidoreductase [Aquificae bacterium]|nr:SDR family NAD(P)-dependent oxidoreductase [Aquificota bacterium]